jgi:hypothetical protein
MHHVKKLNGYEIHSNVRLPAELYENFNPHIALLLKSFIRQYYFKVVIQKEWGMSQTQCYERCLEHDIMAFGLSVPHKKYVILSVIGHRALLNFQKYYHIYKPTKKFTDALLMFPFTMILFVNFEGHVLCDVCGLRGTYSINNQSYCMYRNCAQSKLKITPKDFSFGKLVLSLNDVLRYTYHGEEVDVLKMKCRYCRRNKPHKICTYDRRTNKIKFIRDQILAPTT